MSLDDSRGLIRDLGLIGEAGSVAGLTDAELLGRFAGRRGGAAEVAFEALIVRHGPMVRAACRRALRDPAEADDAFQATFLVLAKKAGSVRVDDSLGPWLRGVARRVSGKAIARSRRRRRVESAAAGLETTAVADLDAIDLGPVLLEELDRLPEKYRAPVVLCHLEGTTHEEAARDLKWPVGTVSGRLSRARDLLRTRLTRRGLNPTAPAILAALAAREAQAVPPTLLEATVRLAMRFAAGGTVPEAVHQLIRGVLAAMFANQIKGYATAASAIALLTAGAGYVAGQVGRANPAQIAPAPKPSDGKANEPATAQDGFRIEINPAGIPGFPETSARSKKMFEASKATPIGSIQRISAMQAPSWVAVAAPDGRSIRAMGLSAGLWEEYRVPDGLRSLPLTVDNLLAIGLAGPEVREVAVFNGLSGEWSRRGLRVPVNGEVVPEALPGLVLYKVGGDFHAYSVEKETWDVLHLEGNQAEKHEFACFNATRGGTPFSGAATLSPNAILVQQGQTLHVFSASTGKWSAGIPVKALESPK